MILLKNVSKTYGKKPIFKNLNLEIQEGEFIGLIGKSGCGKSTLLNMIGLITNIDRGEIFYGKQKIGKPSSKEAMMLRRHTIGYLFQNYGLIDDDSVRDNLMLALEYQDIKQKQKKIVIDEKLKLFGLENYGDKKVYELSGGEQQRVAIIKLILQSSKVILADEPTSGLDEENMHLVLEALKALNENGRTIVMVTHDLRITPYFTRIIDVEKI